MFGQTFYHGHMKKYVVLFGTLFNDIYINRFDSDGDQVATIKVPISYSPKDKMLFRITTDPNLAQPVSTILPRMGFEMTSVRYAPERKLPTINKGYIKQDTNVENKLKYVYNPVPYDFNFSLFIGVKNTEDGTRILEQILPYFTPDWTTTVNLIPELDIKVDIPLILNNISSEDNYDSNFSDRRALVWTLDFTMKGYVFGPVKKSEVITLANVNFYANSYDSTITPDERVTITPGLLANGTGTTNASLTIDRSIIPSNSNYEYIITKSSLLNE